MPAMTTSRWRKRKRGESRRDLNRGNEQAFVVDVVLRRSGRTFVVDADQSVIAGKLV